MPFFTNYFNNPLTFNTQDLNNPATLEENHDNLATSSPGIFFSLINFSVYIFADFTSALCTLCSLVAGICYSMANFLDQEITLDYYGHGNASINYNGTVDTTSAPIYHNTHNLNAQKVFTENTLGFLNYNFQDIINPEHLYTVSRYALAGAILGKMLTRSLHIWVESRENDDSPTTKEYIVNMVDGSINSLQMAFLTSTLISKGLSVLSRPGKPYILNIPSHNGTEPLNATTRPKRILESVETLNYHDNYSMFIKIPSPYSNHLTLPIETDILFTLILDLIFAYTARLRIVNQGDLPEIAAMEISTACLFLTSYFFNRYARELKENRLKFIKSEEIQSACAKVISDSISARQSPIYIGSGDDIDGPPMLENTQARLPYSDEALDIAPLNSTESLDEKNKL